MLHRLSSIIEQYLFQTSSLKQTISHYIEQTTPLTFHFKKFRFHSQP